MIIVPTKLVEMVDFILNTRIDFLNFTERQKLKLKFKLISLWFFLYEEAVKDDNESLKCYTAISSRKLLSLFRLKINNIDFKYNKLLELLESVNLIEINNRYSTDKNFTKSYRIKTDFINGDYTEIEIDYNTINKNLKNKEEWLKIYPEYDKQIKDTYDVKIDLGDYIKWLNDNKGIELKPIFKDGFLTKRYLNDKMIFNYINAALKINFSNLWFKISDEGRFYNSLTNMSYTALPFMKLKRRKIKEIDVKNCQPLLLSYLIKYDLYKKDVEEGIFYEKLSNEMNVSRNETKILTYKYLFFNKNKIKSGKLYEAMNKLYPDLILKINELKDEYDLSKKLQRLESDIFVNKISKLDFKMMLRHDCVFVYEEDYDIIKDIIKNEFKKLKLVVNFN